MLSKETTLNLLKQAADAYYNNEELTMTDNDYDELAQYAEDNGWITQDLILNDSATIKGTNVKHTVPMLSLAKAKTTDELKQYIKRVNTSTHKDNTFIIEPKLDGLALALIYENGNLIHAYTRGTGTQGKDVSYIINHNELTVNNILNKLNNTNIKELRGELVCSKESLIYNNAQRGEPFKNERIASAGLLSKSRLGLGYKAQLDFVAYSAYDVNNKEIKVPEEVYQASTDFKTINFCENDSLEYILEVADTLRESYKYPTDGVVIKMANPVDLGSTQHHPLNAIAYKFPGEEKITKIIGVTWGTGKTGRFTPIAILEPVVIGGVTITNVSLNNMEWIKERNIKVNSIVSVTRANDVIPYIKRVVMNNSDTEDIGPLKVCPYCNSNLVMKSAYLECPNHNCKSTVNNRIKYYVSKGCLDIDGMSNALIDVLKLESVKDLLELDLETLKSTDYSNGTKLGDIRSEQIYSKIQYTKDNTPEYIWLTTLEIPNLGKSTAKSLLSKFGNIDSILNATLEELQEVEGIGNLSARTIIRYRDNAKAIWESIKDSIKIPVNKVKSNGITFCVTGKPPAPYTNRNDYVRAMEEKGYVFHSSIKQDTLFLVCDDINSNSSKVKKAKALGVKIVNAL